MRALYPDIEGYVERDGVKLFYEVFGEGEPTVLLLPTWSIIHSRHWKMQVPYLARYCRVVTFDGRGNGRSDRPTEAGAYAESEFAADAITVMDATQTSRAIIVGFSLGGERGLLLAANQPDRVEAAVFVGPNRYGAGRCMDFDAAGAEAIAAAIAEEVDRPVDYRPVETDGAARAAALIADVL